MTRPTRFLCVFALVIVTTTTAAQSKWHETTDREGGFTVSFPGRPKYQQIPNKAYGFTSESYSFFYGGHDLRISFVPLDPPPRTPAQALKALNDSSASYTTGPGKLIRQDKLADGGRQYENVYSSQGTLMQERTRLYVRHGNLYTLSCITDYSPGIDEQIAECFFSSFRFLEDLPPRPTTPPRRVIKSGTRGPGHAGWYVQRGPDGDFSVEFPSKPDYKLSPNQETGISLHQYLCLFGENHLIVSYRDMAEGEAGGEQLARQSVKSLLEAHPGLRLARQAQLSDGGYEIGMRGVMAGELVYIQTRLYIRGRRVFFVSCSTWNLSGPNNADVPKFFASFRLL
jgi:hypothetical protein